jgi:hypothetical protein
MVSLRDWRTRPLCNFHPQKTKRSRVTDEDIDGDVHRIRERKGEMWWMPTSIGFDVFGILRLLPFLGRSHRCSHTPSLPDSPCLSLPVVRLLAPPYEQGVISLLSLLVSPRHDSPWTTSDRIHQKPSQPGRDDEHTPRLVLGPQPPKTHPFQTAGWLQRQPCPPKGETSQVIWLWIWIPGNRGNRGTEIPAREGKAGRRRRVSS